MKKWKILYSILFFAVCLLPSLGMFFGKSESSSENRELAEFPSLITEERAQCGMASPGRGLLSGSFCLPQ